MPDIKILENLLNECNIAYSGDKEQELIIKSVQLVALVVALEEEFDIEIPDQYLVFENMNTYQKMENMLLEVGASHVNP
ncbi:hypothetical protein KIH86_13550 [Paenibacillus sp. HN-1]|uniref:acyl carrier protein n=1 Tax=Paenibacillus TaxID=44249 RepID=UPI001CA82108|nr:MULTISPECIES: acyl carrier protein [Paenibacillus]MBY9080755.1 hypothetical protein [Paenibacillus sp. CGMCC 1.18879]MBY9085253.1 hypothetical protein [Paenibacillus sinensis]